MQTKFLSIGLLIVTLSYISTNLNLKKQRQHSKAIVYSQPGEKFYKSQCAFCHNADELIAPDMNKIKAAYLKKFKTKDAFIKAVIDFVKNPDKSNAIYKDGIDNFSDMPKMPFKEAQLKAVAEYIYQTKKL